VGSGRRYFTAGSGGRIQFVQRLAVLASRYVIPTVIKEKQKKTKNITTRYTRPARMKSNIGHLAWRSLLIGKEQFACQIRPKNSEKTTDA
jgi:hypothetical protein